MLLYSIALDKKPKMIPQIPCNKIKYLKIKNLISVRDFFCLKLYLVIKSDNFSFHKKCVYTQ